MQIGVIGLGLIGGSIAMELNAQLATQVYGWDLIESHRRQALELELVEDIMTEEEMLENCDIIILAIPVNLIESKLPKLLDQLQTHQCIIDVGSTKKRICNAVKDHPKRAHFVAAHPLAGTEFSGPTAAHRGLFRDKKNIICDQALSNEKFVDTSLRIFKSIGMQSIFLNSEEHDKHLAYVSHLSHISSFMLGHTVLDLEKDEKQIFNLASTGFASTVRLAKSSPQTWNPIFYGNKEYVLEALDSYISHLENFANSLRQDDADDTFKLMQKANEITPVLNGINTNNKI